VVAALGAILLAAASWVAFARWRRDRYRREALRELDRLAPTPANLPAVAVLLKRTALAACERDRVASLTGKDWLAFLDATGGGRAFSGGLGRLLEAATFERHPRPADALEVAELLTAVRHWIRYHQC
jgi:hypothetical protein